ncbi:MAG: type II secretion system protein [Patescibacteria group bacterium]|jgi:type II secretory pathway pseudopilin PulG
MNFDQKKINNQHERPFLKSGAGFTLIETLVAMGIMLALLSVILANYRRGNDDSVLNRETAMLMSNIRLAQEETAAGQILRFCTTNIGQTCKTDSDCPTGDTCNPTQETPKGGYGIVLGCKNGTVVGTTLPWIEHGVDISNPNNPNAYFLYGDNLSCVGSTAYNSCFPMNPLLYNPNGPTSYDRRIGSWQTGENYGDTLEKEVVLNDKVKIKDFKLTRGTDSNLTYYTCDVSNTGLSADHYSPWSLSGAIIPGINTVVPANYPLQLYINFSPPTGRQTYISDNIEYFLPGGPNLTDIWLKAEIMLGVKNRDTDCQVVTVTKEGMISRSVDADCKF